MADRLQLSIDGCTVWVSPGTTVAAAWVDQHAPAIRRSVKGHPRGPLCGMGICFECRATVDGRPQARTCQILCRDGMTVTTDA